jgi:hypothetical protein
MQKFIPKRLADEVFVDVVSGLDAGEDPRVLMARLNREIVAFQKAGEDVPARLMRLTKVLASECIAQSQGR